MRTAIEKNILVIAPEGDIDHHSASRIRAEADRLLLCSGASSIAFDMSGVSFMDSSGIGMIIGRYRKIKILGGRIIIRNACPSVMRIIGLSGLGNIVTIEKEVEYEQNEA